MKKKLTPRQQEIKNLLDEGLTPSEVGKKAKPKITANAVYMTIRRIEEKGHTVKVTESPRGRQRGTGGKPGPKPKPKPPTPENPEHLTGTELIDNINSRLDGDIKAIDAKIEENTAARTQAEQLVARLTEENAKLETTKERLQAIKK